MSEKITKIYFEFKIMKTLPFVIFLQIKFPQKFQTVQSLEYTKQEQKYKLCGERQYQIVTNQTKIIV